MANVELQNILSLDGRLVAYEKSSYHSEDKMAQEQSYRGPQETWVVYDSPLDPVREYSFDSAFCDLLPPGHESLKAYIEDFLEEKKGDAVGIEYGGCGSLLFSSFTKGFFAKTAGVCFVDGSMTQDKWANKKRNHTAIEGDMQSEKVRSDVKEWLDQSKLDLVISRMGGGTKILPQEPFYLFERFQEWYEMMGDESVAFIQIPEIFDGLVDDWQLLVEQKSQGSIEVAISRKPAEWFKNDIKAYMKLIKHANAPDVIPALTFREVYKIANSR